MIAINFILANDMIIQWLIYFHLIYVFYRLKMIDKENTYITINERSLLDVFGDGFSSL